MPAPPRGRDHVTMTFLPAPGSVDVAEKVWLCQLSGNTSFVNRRVWIHGRRQKEEPTSERRRIVCGALRRPLRWLSGGAGPPAVTPHGVVGEPGGARRPESIESAAPTAKRVKLNTAHRSLVLLGHAERSAAQRRWVAGPRRRRRLARQEPSHKKKPWQHQKKTAVQTEAQNYVQLDAFGSVPGPMRHSLAALAGAGRRGGRALLTVN